MSDTYDELDSVVDEARERIAAEREGLAEFARVEDGHGYCEICDAPCVGNICRRCDLFNDGLYEENKWTYSE